MRYGIISDIHSNLAALQAVLNHMGKVDGLWCVGDIVGYGPDPNECVEIIREQAQVCIPGNHDWACVGKIDTSEFNADAAQACLWTQQQLSAENRHYLSTLAETHTEGDFTLAHGSPANPIWEYLISVNSAKESFDHFWTSYCLVGHTHIPVIFQQEPKSKSVVKALHPQTDQPISLQGLRLIINPGSVGQPRDGNPQASYAILDIDGETLEYRRVAYPIETTQQKMVQASLSPKLITRLTYGW